MSKKNPVTEIEKSQIKYLLNLNPKVQNQQILGFINQQRDNIGKEHINSGRITEIKNNSNIVLPSIDDQNNLSKNFTVYLSNKKPIFNPQDIDSTLKGLKYNLKNNLSLPEESEILEYKATYNETILKKLPKIIASFANNKGGIIALGIDDKTKKPLPNNLIELDPANLTNILQKYFEPTPSFSIENIDSIKIIKIKPNPSVIICKKQSNQDIFEGDIYYRYSGKTEKIKYPELSNKINTIINQDNTELIKQYQKLTEKVIELKNPKKSVSKKILNLPFFKF